MKDKKPADKTAKGLTRAEFLAKLAHFITKNAEISCYPGGYAGEICSDLAFQRFGFPNLAAKRANNLIGRFGSSNLGVEQS